MKRSANYATGPVELPVYMTHADIANLLRVTERHVNDVIAKKPGFPVPRGPTKILLYRRADVIAFIESHAEAR